MLIAQNGYLFNNEVLLLKALQQRKIIKKKYFYFTYPPLLRKLSLSGKIFFSAMYNALILLFYLVGIEYLLNLQ